MFTSFFNGAGGVPPDVTCIPVITVTGVSVLQWGRGVIPGCNNVGLGKRSSLRWLQWSRGFTPGCNAA